MKNKRKVFTQADIAKLKANLASCLSDPSKYVSKPLTVCDLLDGMKDDLKKLLDKGYSVADLHKMLNGGAEGGDREIVSRSSLVNYLNANKLRKRKRKQKHQKDASTDTRPTGDGQDAGSSEPTSKGTPEDRSDNVNAEASQQHEIQPTGQGGSTDGTASTQSQPAGTQAPPGARPTDSASTISSQKLQDLLAQLGNNHSTIEP